MTQTAHHVRPLPVRIALQSRPLSLWDSFQASRRNVLSIIPELSSRAPIVSGRTVTPWHMVTDPAANRRILLENQDNYPKSDVTKTILRPAIGDSLFIAEGAHWRWQRRAAAPVFAARNVQALGPVMSNADASAADRIRQAAPNAVNMLDEMSAATFDVIAAVTFSSGDGFPQDAVQQAIETYIGSAGRIALFDVLNLPGWIPRPERMFLHGMDSMRAMADRVIADRAAQGPSPVPDLLDLLQTGEDPDTGRRMSPEEVRDNLLAFIVAGHETTALTLAWALYLLAYDPAAQERASAEVRAVVQGGVARAEDVARLPFLRQVLNETLRLYPPAGMVSRTARAPDRLCDRAIGAGDTVILPIYALHRNVRLWDDPDAFRPDRWHDAAPDRYAFLPFGDGPRICIGASFAIQEAAIILATLLTQFRFRAVPGRVPDPVMIIALRPEGGVWLDADPL